MTDFFLILSGRPRDGYKPREALPIPDHNLDLLVIMTSLSVFSSSNFDVLWLLSKGKSLHGTYFRLVGPTEKKRKEKIRFKAISAHVPKKKKLLLLRFQLRPQQYFYFNFILDLSIRFQC